MRNRNIHPRGRNGWRTQLPGSFLTGGPCSSPSFFLPFPFPSFVTPSSQSPSILPFPRFRFFYLIGAAVIRTAFFFTCSLSLSLSLSLSIYLSIFLVVGARRIAYIAARLFSLPPSPSFFSRFFLFPSHLRAIRSGEAPDESRENTAYRFYSAQSF